MTDRREPSLRAAARAHYQALAEPPPRAAVPEAGTAAVATPLTAEVQALYEAGVMPVREIARLAGVTECTLYKYVRKGGWTRRYPKRNLRGAGGSFRWKRRAGRTPLGSRRSIPAAPPRPKPAPPPRASAPPASGSRV